MNKVCITGGTGFIGSRLALRCQQMGCQVSVLGRTNTPAEADNARILQSAGVEVVLGDITDREKVAAMLNGCQLVFHLAAAQHEADKPDEYFRQINVAGTRMILDAAVEAGVSRFIHGSTIGVYGSATTGELNEETATRPDNIYGVTKLEGENLVLSYQDRLPVTVIRISETYGPGDRRLLKLFKAIGNNTFFLIGKGENKHQPVFVDDLIDCFLQVSKAEAAVGEIFTVSGAEVLSTADMVNTIALVMNQKGARFRAPMGLFLIVASIMERLLPPLGIQPPLHRRRLDFFRKSFYFDGRKAKNLLGFSATTSFERGAELTRDWYQAEGLLR